MSHASSGDFMLYNLILLFSHLAIFYSSVPGESFVLDEMRDWRTKLNPNIYDEFIYFLYLG